MGCLNFRYTQRKYISEHWYGHFKVISIIIYFFFVFLKYILLILVVCPCNYIIVKNRVFLLLFSVGFRGCLCPRRLFKKNVNIICFITDTASRTACSRLQNVCGCNIFKSSAKCCNICPVGVATNRNLSRISYWKKLNFAFWELTRFWTFRFLFCVLLLRKYKNGFDIRAATCLP